MKKAVFKSKVSDKEVNRHLELILKKEADAWMIADFSAVGKRPSGSNIFWID